MSKKGESFDGGPVGYKKPPAEHQFKKGHKRSGGRRKGQKNYATLVEDVLKTRVPVSENGVRRKMVVPEAMLKRATSMALMGTIADIIRFFELLTKLAPGVVEPERLVVHFQPLDGDDEWNERS